MAWLVLIISGILEAVWATALGRSEGFTRLTPTVTFAVARTIPIGTAYAVWVGIGASLTVAFAMLTGEESVSGLKIVLVLVIIGSVMGLKALG